MTIVNIFARAGNDADFLEHKNKVTAKAKILSTCSGPVILRNNSNVELRQSVNNGERFSRYSIYCG